MAHCPIEIAKIHQTPINKSKPNPEVNRLLEEHYHQLYTELVRSDQDRDIFNDTVLTMTYKYERGDFNDLFKKQFGWHKYSIRIAKAINGGFYDSGIDIEKQLSGPPEETGFPWGE